MSFTRQILVILLLVASVVGGFALYDRYLADESASASTGRGGREVLVEAQPVAFAPLRRVIEAVGSTKANQAIDVVPLAAGRVAELNFEAGHEVQAGEVLLRLDDVMEQAALREAEARRREAGLALERARKLQANRNIAQSTVEELVVAEQAALAKLEGAQKELADRTLKAPFAGRLGMRNVDLGARIDNDTIVTTLDDLSKVEVEFSVPEAYFGAVRIDQPVVARAAAYPDRRFEGRVVGIDSRVSTGARAFKVHATLPNADRALPAGMFVYVEIELEQREALLVPEQALQASAGTTFLFVVENGKALRRDVEVGQRHAGQVEISSGITEGALVITSGLQRLRDGIAVKLSGSEAPSERGSKASGKRSAGA